MKFGDKVGFDFAGNGMMNNRVVRCAMFVTPTNPRFIDKAWTRGGDVYILDIEDSIPPAEKERCRSLIRESIHKANKGGASIYVRINKPFVDADLPCSVWPGVDRIMLPKTETAAEMQYAHEIISALEKERGVLEGTIELSPMIETALGAVNIYEILTATPRKIWSMGGGTGYDMAVNLGIEMFAGFDQYAFPAAYVALAAMTLEIEATGGVFVHNPSGRVDQSEHAVEEAEALHAAGIHQAGALHPAFVQPLVSGLSPTPDEIRWANRVIEEYTKLTDVGESVGKLDAKVIDKYEYEMAISTLEWAAACAAKDSYKAHALIRARAEQE
jgi:citrate lyase subunit beta/citryl-CoA lyase